MEQKRSNYYINKSGGVLDGTSRTWYDNGNKKVLYLQKT